MHYFMAARQVNEEALSKIFGNHEDTLRGWGLVPCGSDTWIEIIQFNIQHLTQRLDTLGYPKGLSIAHGGRAHLTLVLAPPSTTAGERWKRVIMESFNGHIKDWLKILSNHFRRIFNIQLHGSPPNSV